MDDTNSVLLSSGYRMPIVGLGTWTTDDDAKAEVALHAALAAGYRHIDTALVYKNEAFLGKVLKQVFQSSKFKREDLFVVTKLPGHGMRPECVEEFCRKSLDNLQMDYVDLYLVHAPIAAQKTDDVYQSWPTKDGVFLGDNVDLLDTWHAMEKLVGKGLARSIGVSNFNSKQIQYVYDGADIKPANLQVECHAYLPQLELHELCKKLNVALTAYSPIGSPGLPKFSKERYGLEVQLDRLLDDPNLKPLIEKHNKTASQILLRYLIQRGVIVIPKSSNPERIRENISVFDFSLSDEEIASIKTWGKNYRYFKFNVLKGMSEHPEYPFHLPY